MQRLQTFSIFGIMVLSLIGCSSTSGPYGGVGTSSIDNSSQQQSLTHPKLNGAIIGQQIGTGLDATSIRAALQAEYDALETGKPGQNINWAGSNGLTGFVTPQQTYQVGSQNCRRYIHTIVLNGQRQQGSGTACRNPDGSWSALS